MKKIFSSILIIILAANVFAQIPTTDLLVHYAFNKNASDSGDFKMDGTIIGAKLTSDRFGKDSSAFYFDGLSRINCGNSTIINTINEGLTISVWIQSGISQPFRAIVTKWPVKQQSDHFGLWLNFTRPTLAIGHPSFSSGGATATNPISNLQDWHHIVGIWQKGGKHIIYVDNLKVLDVLLPNYNIITTNSTAELLIGSDGENRSFTGKIDDIRIYKRALDEMEIKQLFNEEESTIVTALNKNQLTNENIYPNPTKDQLNFSKTQSYKISNLQGLEILKGEGDQVDVSQLNSGIYLITIEGVSQKFIKE